MQNIRVANGHTKELQRGCAKGQKKEQPPQKQTNCPGSNPGSASRQPTALPLGQNLLVEQRQVGAIFDCGAAKAPARCAGKP